MRRTVAAAIACAVTALVACPGMRPSLDGRGAHGGGDGAITGACGGLDRIACDRARGMISAATAFSNVKHEYILDPTSSFAPGRGLEKTESGAWIATTTACAEPHAPNKGQSVDAARIDFGYVGVAIDNVLVAADADLTPYLAAGGSAAVHKVRLVAIAFVRDNDPQFFDASDEVTAVEGPVAGCACGRATHYVGAVKIGGLLAYETEVRSMEVHARALEFVKARLEGGDARVTETRVGGLEVQGLGDIGVIGGGNGATSQPLSFKVTTPVPIAYAVYPIADVCKFSLPAPEVTPAPLDFGEVPYGREGTRLLHIVNRAPIDLFASYRGNLIDVQARASFDLEVRWAPDGDASGCDAQVREEAIVFTPRDPRLAVTPRQQSVRVVEHVRTGRASAQVRVHVDTGEARAPDYAATARDLACPPDFVVSACRTENAQCGAGGAGSGANGAGRSSGLACAENGYALSAAPSGSGCHFACSGPSSYLPLASNSCRFDAVVDCRLRCGAK
jgi:hypothetical protein